GFIKAFRVEPLLYTPLGQGGHPRQILRSTLAQIILRALAANLPRLGLLRETLELVRTAKTMEDQQSLTGPRVTEFDRLFQHACQALVEAVVDSATSASGGRELPVESGSPGAAAQAPRQPGADVPRSPASGPGPQAADAPRSPRVSAEDMVRVLETLVEPLLGLWIQHSDGLRVSTIETLGSATEWERLYDFIRRYGRDL